MTPGMINALITQGGFAVLAAVCIFAIVQVVKIGVGQMERSHLREVEALKLVTADRGEMIKQLTDLMLEVRSALVSLQDEIVSLHRASDSGGVIARERESARREPDRTHSRG